MGATKWKALQRDGKHIVSDGHVVIECASRADARNAAQALLLAYVEGQQDTIAGIAKAAGAPLPYDPDDNPDDFRGKPT